MYSDIRAHWATLIAEGAGCAPLISHLYRSGVPLTTCLDLYYKAHADAQHLGTLSDPPLPHLFRDHHMLSYLRLHAYGCSLPPSHSH